ncbi:MAG: periplasmic heavy metal sensor [Pseudomonadota bacterium]
MTRDPKAPQPNSADAKPRPKRRWMRVVLGLSLGVNVLVIGLILGVVFSFRGGPGGAEGPGLRAFGLGPIALAMEREDRTALRARLQAERGNFRTGGEGFAQGLRALSEALRAEPFDPEAAEAALLLQRDTARELHGEGHQILLEYFGDMSRQGRLAMADRLDRRLERNIGRGGEPRGDY